MGLNKVRNLHCHHSTILGRLVRWWGDLIMITPFWPDQSWFPEIMHLGTEVPRHFWPSCWLLWNATIREAIPRVKKSTAWRLTSPSVSRMASEKKLPGRSLTPRQKEPSRTTGRCFNSGVLYVIRWGYHSLKFVWATWWNTLNSFR